MAAGRTSSVDPSGRSQTERVCCSNWLVAQATSVAWKVLCGRGASSFTKSSPARVRKNSATSSPSTPSAAAMSRAIDSAWFATAWGSGPGSTLHSRMPLMWWLSAGA